MQIQYVSNGLSSLEAPHGAETSKNQSKNRSPSMIPALYYVRQNWVLELNDAPSQRILANMNQHICDSFGMRYVKS
eukprot:3380055-Amphidinium_carterae.1